MTVIKLHIFVCNILSYVSAQAKLTTSAILCILRQIKHFIKMSAKYTKIMNMQNAQIAQIFEDLGWSLSLYL